MRIRVARHGALRLPHCGERAIIIIKSKCAKAKFYEKKIVRQLQFHSTYLTVWAHCGMLERAHSVACGQAACGKQKIGINCVLFRFHFRAFISLSHLHCPRSARAAKLTHWHFTWDSVARTAFAVHQTSRITEAPQVEPTENRKK